MEEAGLEPGDPDMSGLRDIASRWPSKDPDDRRFALEILSEPSGAELSRGEPRRGESGGEPDRGENGPREQYAPQPVKADKTGEPAAVLSEEGPGSCRDAPEGPRSRWTARRVTALASALLLVIAVVIVVAVKFFPHDDGCSARLAGTGGNEPIGFVTSSCFLVSSAMSTADQATEKEMASVAGQIEHQNGLIGSSPYRTVVFFGVMSETSGTVNPASLYQLRGTLSAQMCQNGQSESCPSGPSTSKFKMRVLLANPGSDFEDGQSVAQQIIDRAKQDSSIVAVIGIGQSWTNSLAAVHMLRGASLPVIGTAVTGDAFSDPALSNFFRISPDNTSQARLAASFAKEKGYKKVIILANLNAIDNNQDLYSGELGEKFTSDFTDSSHSVVKTCDYGDTEPLTVSCGPQHLTASALRKQLCQYNSSSDLIFFAARAVTLPDLLNTPGETCELPAILGSSDVPKYIGNPDLRNSSAFYYLSFAPAKQSKCFTPAKHPYQTTAECTFIAAYRGKYQREDGLSTKDPDDSPILSFDSSDAMLGADALQTVIVAIDMAGGSPGTSGASVIGELNSGDVSFNGVSGLISFPKGQRTSVDHPIYVTSLGQNSLTVQISCGQYGTGVLPGTDLGCPAFPY